VSEPPSILEAAEALLDVLADHRVQVVVIGAVALAAHNYVRQTEDFNLGVNADDGRTGTDKCLDNWCP
jgi:hypothetical protein